MTDDCGYLNARVRVMKGRLLGESSWRAALECASVDELLSFLGSTPYAAAVDEATSVKKGIAGIEEGLRADFQRTIDHLLRIAGGRPRELLAIALGRWELFNLKTVLRGRHARAGLEAVMGSAIPFGRLDEVALQELSRQPDVKAAIDLLAQWRIPAAPALRAAYPRYLERGDFSVLEAALDASFFASSLRVLDPARTDDAVVAGLLRSEIDLILLGYALRVAHHAGAGADTGAQAHAAELFIPGGRTITRPVFERLCAARGVRELVELVPPSPLAACLAAGSKRRREARGLFALDRLLQLCFFRETLRLILRDPLSIAFTIGYLWRKTGEIVNLRLIARGKHAAVPREEIEALLLPAG